MLTERDLREFDRYCYMVAAKDVVPLLDAKDAEIAGYVKQLAELLNSYSDTLGEMIALRQALGLHSMAHLGFEGHAR